MSYVFLRNEDAYNVEGNSFEMLGVATEKACLRRLSLVLETEELQQGR